MEGLRKTAGVFLDKCVWLLLTGEGLICARLEIMSPKVCPYR